jgi:hypothetical protein
VESGEQRAEFREESGEREERRERRGGSGERSL